ncbi:MAG: MucB/RseB C-terminal domain-containing protein [Chromatocurvus sp.]
MPSLLWAQSRCDGADAGALELLERMSRAGMAVSHRGMATLQRGGDMRVLRIRRDIDGEGVTDTLTLLTGQSAQVVRAGHPESCTHPGHTLLRLQRDEGDVCGVAAHYRLSLEPGDQVAGRATRKITARPRDMYRYAHVLEIDEQTAQLLKETTLTADGRPLEQFQYASFTPAADADTQQDAGANTDLDTGGHADAEQASETPYRHPASHSEGPDTGTLVSEAAPITTPWKPEWLPDGFVATQNDAAGPRQTYTDGMASFSVFLEPVSTAMQPGEGAVREGSTLAYTRGLRLAGSTVLVSVIGEVPVNTARIVADSVRLR